MTDKVKEKKEEVTATYKSTCFNCGNKIKIKMIGNYHIVNIVLSTCSSCKYVPNI